MREGQDLLSHSQALKAIHLSPCKYGQFYCAAQERYRIIPSLQPVRGRKSFPQCYCQQPYPPSLWWYQESHLKRPQLHQSLNPDMDPTEAQTSPWPRHHHCHHGGNEAPLLRSFPSLSPLQTCFLSRGHEPFCLSLFLVLLHTFAWSLKMPGGPKFSSRSLGRSAPSLPMGFFVLLKVSWPWAGPCVLITKRS